MYNFKGTSMSMKIVPESMKLPEPEIELVEERHRLMTRIKYPAPNPRHRIDDEYYNEDDDSE